MVLSSCGWSKLMKWLKWSSHIVLKQHSQDTVNDNVEIGGCSGLLSESAPWIVKLRLHNEVSLSLWGRLFRDMMLTIQSLDYRCYIKLCLMYWEVGYCNAVTSFENLSPEFFLLMFRWLEIFSTIKMPFTIKCLLEYTGKRDKFAEYESRVIGAQVVFKYLNLVHRDLKKDKVVTDRTGYIQIVDYRF